MNRRVSAHITTPFLIHLTTTVWIEFVYCEILILRILLYVPVPIPVEIGILTSVILLLGHTFVNPQPVDDAVKLLKTPPEIN